MYKASKISIFVPRSGKSVVDCDRHALITSTISTFKLLVRAVFCRDLLARLRANIFAHSFRLTRQLTFGSAVFSSDPSPISLSSARRATQVNGPRSWMIRTIASHPSQVWGGTHNLVSLYPKRGVPVSGRGVPVTNRCSLSIPFFDVEFYELNQVIWGSPRKMRSKHWSANLKKNRSLKRSEPMRSSWNYGAWSEMKSMQRG